MMKRLPMARLRRGPSAVRLESSEAHFERCLAELDVQDADWDRELRVGGALRRLTSDSSTPSRQRAVAIFGNDIVEEAVRLLHVAHASSDAAQVPVNIESAAPVDVVVVSVARLATKLSKVQKVQAGKVDSTKLYALSEALELLKSMATAKFDEAINIPLQLGIGAQTSSHIVRGASVIQSGAGKTKRVAVFAQDLQAEEARAAGADVVGMEDLAERIKEGDMPFDMVIASPSAMRVVGTLGHILGPRGLMPNPKVGTLTPDIATAVKNAKAGQVQLRVGAFGRRSFDTDTLNGRLRTLIAALNNAERASIRFAYLRNVGVQQLTGTHPSDTVSYREMEILRLSAEGKSPSQIARILGLSKAEVKDEASAVLGKLHRGLSAT